jgi:hypothetical protein
MTTIRGAPGHEIELPLTLGALLNGTTVTRAVIRARGPRGGPFLDWEADLEDPAATSISLVYQLTEQLESGLWHVEPFLFTGGTPGTLVTSLYFDTVQFRVEPSAVPAPT